MTITSTSLSKFKKYKSSFSDEEYQEVEVQQPSSIMYNVECFNSLCFSIIGQGPWIIDSGASNHISGNASLFSSLSSAKFPHLITLANGTKVASKGVGQISLLLP